MGQRTDDTFCWCNRFQRDFDLAYPKIKGQKALIIVQHTTVSYVTLPYYCLFKFYTKAVSHTMWGNDLLGGGLRSLGAFPVIVIVRVLVQAIRIGQVCLTFCSPKKCARTLKLAHIIVKLTPSMWSHCSQLWHWRIHTLMSYSWNTMNRKEVLTHWSPVPSSGALGGREDFSAIFTVTFSSHWRGAHGKKLEKTNNEQ